MLRSALATVAMVLVGATTANAQNIQWRLEVAAGGGFAGVSEVQVQTEPNLTCNAATPPLCTPDPANKALVKNKAYSWRPAVATGCSYRPGVPLAVSRRSGEGCR
jgi:hypothetical protein